MIIGKIINALVAFLWLYSQPLFISHSSIVFLHGSSCNYRQKLTSCRLQPPTPKSSNLALFRNFLHSPRTCTTLGVHLPTFGQFKVVNQAPFIVPKTGDGVRAVLEKHQRLVQGYVTAQMRWLRFDVILRHCPNETGRARRNITSLPLKGLRLIKN